MAYQQNDDAISEMSEFAEEIDGPRSGLDDNCGSHSDESESGPGTDLLAEEPGEESMEIDPDRVEERFRVDRRKLEQMLQAAEDGKAERGEDFFQRIMRETETTITWPSKLKIGAKSKKDPHIKVAGKLFHVAAAKEKIMSVLDTKSNRVTLKMDVSYTEHSHVIGKGGAIIKKVMDDTKCHIHFPDSNRGSGQEKSNQVSIAGQIGGVEQARAKIRELLPLVLIFELPISMGAVPSMNSPIIQEVVQTYKVAVNMKQRGRGYSTTVTVRGAANNARGMKEGTSRLMEHLTGTAGGSLPVSTQIEISPQHHQFMMGRGGLNIKQISQCTGASIHFPDPNSTQKKSSVFISGSIDAVIIARHLLMGCLPLVLMFDMKDEVEVHTTRLTQLMEQLDIFISIKPKPKQPNKSVIIKSIERNAPNMYRARQILLGQECESCAANANSCPSLGMNGTCLPMHGYNVGTLGLLGHAHHRHHQTPITGLAPSTAVLPTLNGLTSLNNLNALHQSALTSTTSSPTHQWTLHNIPTSIPTGMSSGTVTPVLVSQPINPVLLTSPRGSVTLTVNSNANPTVTNPTPATISTAAIPTAATIPSAMHTIHNVGGVQTGVPVNQAAGVASSPLSGNSNLGAMHVQQNVNTPAIQSTMTSPTGAGAVHQGLNVAKQTAAVHDGQGGIPHLVPSAGAIQAGLIRHPNAAAAIQQAALQMNHHPAPGANTPTSNQQTSGMSQPPMLPHQTLQATMQQMENALQQVHNQQQQHQQQQQQQQQHQQQQQQSLPLNVNTSIPPPPLPQDFLANMGLACSSAASTSMQPTGSLDMAPATTTTTPRTPPPPPGFARPDPMTVTSQLAQLELSDLASAGGQLSSMCNNNNHMKDLMMQLKSMQMDPVAEAGMKHSQLLGQSSRDASPIDLITTVTPPLGQLGQSAMPHEGALEHSGGSSSGHSLPRSPTSFVDLVLAQNNNCSPSSSLKLQNTNFSPNNSSHDLSGMLGGGRRSLTPEEASVSLFSSSSGSITMNGYGRRSSESGCDSDSSDKRAPGCERRERRRERKMEKEQQEGEKAGGGGGDPAKEHHSPTYGDDYDQKKFLATKAMKKKPLAPEVRVPTDLWSGLGFSKSMPESAIREARRTNGFSLFQRDSNPLPTTYETPTHEDSEHIDTQPTSTWPPDRPTEDTPMEKTVGFETMQEFPKKKKTTFSDISCSNYIESTTLPKTSKGLWAASDLNASVSSRPDLGDLFMNLGLGKYTDVFQQQEIDLSTFLTLTDKDLKELGITTFGARRKMLLAITDINKTNKDTFSSSPPSQGYHSNGPGNGFLAGQTNQHATTASCW